MKIVCYFINYNDSFYLPFLKQHYGAFCEKIIMYDNYSSDGSHKLAEHLGFEVRKFGRPGVLDDQHYLDVKNHCWKEQIGQGVDYVIVVDADEFVCIDNLQPGDSAPVVNGFNMISEILPLEHIFEINTGAPSESYSKQAIFNPDMITEINYVHGCHRNRMTGRIIREQSCRLLHYRQIGGVKRMLERHAAYMLRMSAFNIKHGMGIHYTHTDAEKIREWELLTADAKVLWNDNYKY